MNGIIKQLHPEKDFGFIKGDDNQEYFFHHSGLKNCKFEELDKGQNVTFEESDGPKGLRAEDIYV